MAVLSMGHGLEYKVELRHFGRWANVNSTVDFAQ
jgi:hypothetical protein